MKELWPGWETVEPIGSGGFSKVYKIRKSDSGDTEDYTAALKIISIPQSADEYETYALDGYDDDTITGIFTSQVKRIVEEFRLMAQFKGNSNIVSYEDHMIVPHADGKGWDILIRMELLTSLPKYCNQAMLSEEETVKLGIGICRALELCQKQNIIHRDIKPQNIFVNRFGDYKLGDFGIAKSMDHTTHATKTGTYSYMAPEVYRGDAYGLTIDLYSLGLVLYWLLNERRLPFLPLPPKAPTAMQINEAQAKRLAGEALLPPKNGSEQLKRIVLKACAYNAADRYATAAQMRRDLEKALIAIEEAAEAVAAAVTPATPATPVTSDVPEDDGNDKTMGLFAYHESVNTAKPEKAAEQVGEKAPEQEPVKIVEEVEKTVGLFSVVAPVPPAKAPEIELAPVAEPVVEEAPEIEPAPIAEPAVEEAPEIEPAPIAEPAVEEAPEIEPAPVAESAVEEEPEIEPAPIAEPVVEEEPEIEPAPVAEPAVEEVPESEEKPKKSKKVLIFASIGALLLLVIGGVLLSHRHSYTWAWSDTAHWQECSCGESDGESYHIFGSWSVMQEATSNATGLQERVCTVCGYKQTETIPVQGHEHSYTVTWVKDTDSHWKECSCGNKKDTAAHTYGEWKVTKAATETQTGTKERTCTACVYKQTETIPKLESSGSKGLAYTLNADGTYSVSGIGTCTDKAVVIPATYNGKAVTAIGSYAFKRCTDLTNISIPNSVTSIGSGAFYDCSGLTSITIPAGVKEIFEYTFNYCTSLTSITISNGVGYIGDGAFQGCSELKSITIPKSVLHIGVQAFWNCFNLTSIEIPSSVTGIGYHAFSGCTALRTIYCEAASKPSGWNSFWLGDCTATVYWGSTSLKYAQNNDGTYRVTGKGTCTDKDLVIPATYNGKAVTAIGNSAFWKLNGLTSITIPGSVTSIGESAFNGCTGLTSITIPNSVTSIGGYAFYDCSRLTSITIPSSVTSIGEDAFTGCTSLRTIYCEASSKPAGWNASWLGNCSATVYWGQ